MAKDVVVELAHKRAIAISAEIEVQLSKTSGGDPIIAMLVKARKEAASALAALADVDPVKTGEILKLQTEICRFRDLVRWLTALVQEGFEADRVISEEAREELIDAIAGSPDDDDVEPPTEDR